MEAFPLTVMTASALATQHSTAQHTRVHMLSQIYEKGNQNILSSFTNVHFSFKPTRHHPAATKRH